MPMLATAQCRLAESGISVLFWAKLKFMIILAKII